jgi:hypothetical protein
MNDRESIIIFLRKQATDAAAQVLSERADVADKVSRAALIAAAQTFADQIERGDDLKPTKPPVRLAISGGVMPVWVVTEHAVKAAEESPRAEAVRATVSREHQELRAALEHG